MFKFTLYFSISFVILSFPLGGKPIFNHVNHFTSPYTENIYKSVNAGAKKGVKAGKEFFLNTTPKIDKIKTKYSSLQKSNKRIDQEIDSNHGNYTVEEKELLKKVLKKAESY